MGRHAERRAGSTGIALCDTAGVGAGAGSSASGGSASTLCCTLTGASCSSAGETPNFTTTIPAPTRRRTAPAAAAQSFLFCVTCPPFSVALVRPRASRREEGELSPRRATRIGRHSPSGPTRAAHPSLAHCLRSGQEVRPRVICAPDVAHNGEFRGRSAQWRHEERGVSYCVPGITLPVDRSAESVQDASTRRAARLPEGGAWSSRSCGHWVFSLRS